MNAVDSLIEYAVRRGLLPGEDKTYAKNRIFEALELPGPTDARAGSGSLEDILKSLLDDACTRGVIPGSITHRDLLDTKIMGCVTPPPSMVARRFRELYDIRPENATGWFYTLAKDSDYIRAYRTAKDVKWTADTEYGAMDITINLAKPEKDPLAIAEAGTKKTSGYPQCALCPENEGYAGHAGQAARQTLRIIPITLGGERWGLQYSPYVYYNEHCIALSERHTPMKIDGDTFRKLFDFVSQFPHYFIGSNADLPIVGGSILAHEHFQGGRHVMPMERAASAWTVRVSGFGDVEAAILHWPLSVIRLRSVSADRLCVLGERILAVWRGYQDVNAGIFAFTDGVPHNTVTPIARRRGGAFELDLVLRNNRTTPEHPLGLFHPHEEIHHIKKENIGLIEVMGLAVLPARLSGELLLLERALLSGGDVRSNPRIAPHAAWAEGIMARHKVDDGNVTHVLREEVGRTFVAGLEHCGVFAPDGEGREAFGRFLKRV